MFYLTQNQCYHLFDLNENVLFSLYQIKLSWKSKNQSHYLFYHVQISWFHYIK